jgi:DNA-binding CsgD family transcriptional regulator
MKLANIEFFADPFGNVMIADEKGVHAYEMEDEELTSALFVRIQDEYPEAFQALTELYRKSMPNAPYFRYRVCHRFIRCNFSVYDRKQDIDGEGRFRLEDVQCPLRTECLYAGTICGAKFNTRLTQRQEEVMRLYVQGSTEQEIAEALFISPETVHSTKRNAYRKAGVHSLAEFIQKVQL